MAQLAEVRDLPNGRVVLTDDEGRMLRASWYLSRGFVNVSVWRDDRCSETFHLSVGDAARLAGFLVEGLGDATAGLLRTATSPSCRTRRAWHSPPPAALTAVRSARSRLAAWIDPS